MALHTGDAKLRDAGNYAGETIIRTARLRALAHGGQVVASRQCVDLARRRRCPTGPTGSTSARTG